MTKIVQIPAQSPQTEINFSETIVTCTKCGTPKTTKEFNGKKYKDKYYYYECKVCENKRKSLYYLENPDKKPKYKHISTRVTPALVHEPIKGEKWKSLLGSAGKYLISNKGRIFSLWSNTTIKPRIKNKYLFFKVNGKHKPIHRLVGIHFIPNPYNKPQINHIDGIRDNNDYKNLEWCTGLENVQHAVRTGLFMSEKRKLYTDGTKGKFPQQFFNNVYINKPNQWGKNNHKSQEVYVFDLKYNFVTSYESHNICAREIKRKQSCVTRAINRGYKCANYYISTDRHKYDNIKTLPI